MTSDYYIIILTRLPQLPPVTKVFPECFEIVYLYRLSALTSSYFRQDFTPA